MNIQEQIETYREKVRYNSAASERMSNEDYAKNTAETRCYLEFISILESLQSKGKILQSKGKTKEELGQLFKNSSDCYADTSYNDRFGTRIEGEVIQAMTEVKFIEIMEEYALSLERKAWECSVEMMEESRSVLEPAEVLKQHSEYAQIRRNGISTGYKYSAYKIRDAFGFSRSETPDKFKEKKS